MQIHILIVDDEDLSRDLVKNLVNEFEPHAVIEQARNGKEALALLNEKDFDIVFTDIRMPESNGFRFLSLVENRKFELVFITAYSEHALQAIKVGAADYLLKPVKKGDFKDTFLKIRERIVEKRERRSEIFSASRESFLNNRMAITHQQGIKFITLKDIVYLEADNSYTNIYLSDGEKIMTSKPIHKFEGTLDSDFFFRIHKSYIINIIHFKEYLSKEGNFAFMDNGAKLTISRYRLSQFLDVVNELSGKLKL